MGPRRERRYGGLGDGLLARRGIDDGLVQERAGLAERDPQRGRGLGGRPAERQLEPAVLLGHQLGPLRRREVALGVLGVGMRRARVLERLDDGGQGRVRGGGHPVVRADDQVLERFALGVEVAAQHGR